MSFLFLTRNRYNTGRHKQKKIKNSKHKNLVAQKNELCFFGTVHVGYANSHKTVVPACTAFFLTILLFFGLYLYDFRKNSEVLDALGVQLCLCFGLS